MKNMDIKRLNTFASNLYAGIQYYITLTKAKILRTAVLNIYLSQMRHNNNSPKQEFTDEVNT